MIRDFLTITLISMPFIVRADVGEGILDDSDVNDAPDVYVKINAVPTAALTKLREETGGIAFEEVEIDEVNGVTIYALEWESEGRVFDTAVGVAGHLIKRDEKIAVQDVPNRVRRSMLAYFPAAALLEVEYTSLVMYEIDDLFEDDVSRVEVDPTGVVVSDRADKPSYYSTARPVEFDQIPQAAQEAILRESAGRQDFDAMARETIVGVDRFKADWTVDGRQFSARVSDDGLLIERAQSITADDLPGSVRQVVESLEGESQERRYWSKLTLFYDVDAALIQQDYRLEIDPEGRILNAQGGRDRTMSAPIIRLDGEDIVVHHQVLVGMPSPQLEVSSGLLGAEWTEISMTPVGGFVLEARLRREDAAVFRIRFGD